MAFKKQDGIEILELKAKILKIKNLLNEILAEWKLQRKKKISKVEHMARKIAQTEI